MAHLSFLVLVSIACLILVHLAQRYYRYIKLWWIVNKIPGPVALPIVGSAYTLIGVKREDLLKTIIEDVKKHRGPEGIFRLWLGYQPEIILTKPHQIEVLLTSRKYIRKGDVYRYLKPWLGEGLITSNGATWQERRKLLTPTFHFSILKEFIDVMLEKNKILMEIIDKKVTENPDKPIDIYALVTRYALDVICESAMGAGINAQRNPNHEYTTSIKNIEGHVYRRMVAAWLKTDWIYNLSQSGRELAKDVKVVRSFTDRVIEERKKQRMTKPTSKDLHDSTDGNKKPKAFLDILLDARERSESSLTDNDIRDEVNTFLFAGHETTSITVSICLFCIGNKSEIQEKIHEELNIVFGDSNEPATIKELSALKYLQLVLKESLRLYPSVPFLSRQLDEDLIIDGYTIPRGCHVILNIFYLHRDPDLWPNPETFDPDRFLPENSRGRPPFSFIPFSAGSRNCIGQKFAQQEALSCLTSILRKWYVRSERKFNDLNIYGEISLHPQEAINIFFTPKKQS